VGWQQRDWAKFEDGELQELYGVVHRVAPRRGAFWAVIVSLLLTVLGVGWVLRPQPEAVRGAGITPSALYGTIIPEGSTLGPAGVCQELELTDGAWRCDTVAVNLANVPVLRATPYNGPCTHLRGVGGRWACLSVTPGG
jgi:hypothetical protein